MRRGCRRFSRLLSEREDGPLTPRDEAFLMAHRKACPHCQIEETQGAISLDLLRHSGMDVEVRPEFGDRVVRRALNGSTAESLRYWTPAFLGAAIAGFAMLAALQIVTRSSQLPQVQVPGAETRRYERPTPYLPPLGPETSVK